MTTSIDTPANPWVGLPDHLAEALTAAGITPDNVVEYDRSCIAEQPGCGPGTARLIVRAGHRLADMPAADLDEYTETLQLPVPIYKLLVAKGFELLSDFTGDPGQGSAGADGCYLIQCGFTVNQVANIRGALDAAGSGFADLSGKRTLADIPFDPIQRELFRTLRIDTTKPLREGAIDQLMHQLSGALGKALAERHRERVTHAFWVAGYDLL